MGPDSAYHVPVLVDEVIGLLEPERGGTYLDGTIGGGGHAEAILERSEAARLIGTDRDPDALGAAAARLARFGERVQLVRCGFADAPSVAGIGAASLAGVLLDLGVSSHQLDRVERGFTFRPGSPLDMRMAQAAESGATAADLLNELSEAELADIFFRYGEERRSRRLAREIVAMRSETGFERSEQLVEAIERALGSATTIQDRARLFQALRIAVNLELEQVELGLERLRETLEVGGVLVVLSYHSLEDRIVKDAFREWSRACICPPQLPVCRCRGAALGEPLTRKPVVAGAAEIRMNPRSRSAKLRAWRRG